MKVVILPEVVDYLLELSDILYDKGSFGFEETAIRKSIWKALICLYSIIV